MTDGDGIIDLTANLDKVRPLRMQPIPAASCAASTSLPGITSL